ncbi:MAG: flagellar export chaperone FliS [Planctomycetes bacterium]|nr:flagellar export chaperone FliS [Planctomycetota bacterium]
MAPNPQNQYLKTQVLTASPQQLVLMLFDGAIRFIETARKAWQTKDIETAHKSLIRAQEIILELTYSLNREKGAEIAENMSRLYGFCYRQLVEANIQHSEELLDPVQNILRELRATWAEAIVKADQEGQVNPEPTREGAVPEVTAENESAGSTLPQAEDAPPPAEERTGISVQG